LNEEKHLPWGLYQNILKLDTDKLDSWPTNLSVWYMQKKKHEGRLNVQSEVLSVSVYITIGNQCKIGGTGKDVHTLF
jgi:hypothetical protein